MADTTSITRELYDSFQRGQLDRWNGIFAPDVAFYSPGYWGGRGLDALKGWGGEFIKAFEPRIDLVDELSTGDRPFITINLNWKHVKPFFDVKPTGREGTSIETFLLTVKNGRIERFQVLDGTLDLAIYLWERGHPQAHNVHPEPLIKGIERRG